jgi:hypothetical protein
MMDHDDLVASREYIFETNEPRSRDLVTVQRVGWEAGIVIVVWRGGQHACVPIEEFLISAEPLVPYKGGSTFEFDPLLRREVPPKGVAEEHPVLRLAQGFRKAQDQIARTIFRTS